MRVSLYWKLLFGFGFVIALLAVADVYILYELTNLSTTTRIAVTGDARSVDVAKQLRTVLYEEERHAQKLLATDDSTYLLLFREQQRAASILLDTLSRFGADTTISVLVHATDDRHAWFARAVDSARMSVDDHVVSTYQERMTDTLDLIYRDVQRLVSQKQLVLASAVESAGQSSLRAREVALWVTIGAVLVAVAIALVQTRAITRPITALVRATDEVAGGTFTQVEIPPKGEIGRLAVAFNHMGDRIRTSNAARAEMMHHISHEIRMPLQTMHSAYYLLSEGQAGPITDRQKKLLSMMRDNIDKIARFSNQFLDLARIEAGMMEFDVGPTDLNAVLRPLVEEASLNAARKDIQLSYVPSSVPLAQGNSERCVQIFANLLSNAVKYSDAGGHIRISLVPSVFGVRVVIADSGIGIAPEELANVFKKFYRAGTGGRRSGTGIGLALVKALVEHMGGKIGVHSIAGHGSSFIVEFQVA